MLLLNISTINLSIIPAHPPNFPLFLIPTTHNSRCYFRFFFPFLVFFRPGFSSLLTYPRNLLSRWLSTFLPFQIKLKLFSFPFTHTHIKKLLPCLLGIHCAHAFQFNFFVQLCVVDTLHRERGVYRTSRLAHWKK